MNLYSNFKRKKVDAPSKPVYSANDYARIKTYHDKMIENKANEYVVDDITWNDLDMDSIFSKLNNTCSTVGEEYLYHLLHCPKSNMEELSDIERLKTYFLGNDEKIDAVKSNLFGIGRITKYSLTDSLYSCLKLDYQKNSIHYIIDLLILLSFALIFYVPSWGVLSFFVMLAVGIITYFKYKAKIDRYITSMIYVLAMLKAADKLTKLKIDGLDKELKELGEINKSFASFKKNTYVLATAFHTTENPIELLMDYARMIFHVDIIKFNSMLRTMKDHMEDVERLREILGIIDASYAISEFLKENASDYSRPEFEKNSSELVLEEAFHPLTKVRIPNSITAKRGVLITGSNASGKSTFLKMVAISAILAQTINMVPAKRYKGDFYRIYSSMALRDSIVKKESYFIVEIKSLKRIVDATNERDEMPVMCFIDEVLRGTNTVERIAASSEILKSLCDKGVLCFAATHDIELTYILEDVFENYHFEEQFVDGDITFDHKIYPGRSHTQNAIKLLSVIGYDDKVVGAARKKADTFVSTGVWEK